MSKEGDPATGQSVAKAPRSRLGRALRRALSGPPSALEQVHTAVGLDPAALSALLADPDSGADGLTAATGVAGAHVVSLLDAAKALDALEADRLERAHPGDSELSVAHQHARERMANAVLLLTEAVSLVRSGTVIPFDSRPDGRIPEAWELEPAVRLRSIGMLIPLAAASIQQACSSARARAAQIVRLAEEARAQEARERAEHEQAAQARRAGGQPPAHT